MHPENSRGPEQRERGLNFAAQSEASELHPDRNEDAMLAVPEHGLFGVFDGMSTPRGGEVAAELARDTVRDVLREIPNDAPNEIAKDGVREALLDANRVIQEYALEHRLGDIGTTATAGKILEYPDGTKVALIANVGDSRAYLLRGDGALECLTLDDGLSKESAASREQAWELQRKFSNVVDHRELSPGELQQFMHRHILTQAVGHESSPSLYSIEVQPGDKLLLCSDGIHDNLTDSEIEKIVSTQDPETSVHELTAAAIARSHEKDVMTGEREHLRAKVDDMTAIIVEIPASTP